MIAIVLIGVFGGIKLDKWMGIKFPIFTITLSIFSVFVAVYIVIKDLLKKKK